MNNKGVSAIIGVMLMVAITIAIAAMIYVYVSDVTENPEGIFIEGNITGVLKGYSKTKDTLKISNTTLNNVRSFPEGINYFIGRECTIEYRQRVPYKSIFYGNNYTYYYIETIYLT